VFYKNMGWGTPSDTNDSQQDPNAEEIRRLETDRAKAEEEYTRRNNERSRMENSELMPLRRRRDDLEQQRKNLELEIIGVERRIKDFNNDYVLAASRKIEELTQRINSLRR